MKITALEIRQKTFEKEFRGLNKAEVSAFLLSLSHAWESMVEEKKSLKSKLEQSEKEVQKLREIENSLFKTLQTAENTGASMVEQANRSAELLMKETRLKAEQLYNDAQQKADKVIGSMQEEIRNLEQEFRTIENQKDTLLREIKAIANDSLERVNKVSNDRKDLSFIREKAQNISNELRNEPIAIVETPQIEIPKVEEKKVEIVEEVIEVETSSKIQFEEPILEEDESIQEEVVEIENKKVNDGSQKSFFDDVTE